MCICVIAVREWDRSALKIKDYLKIKLKMRLIRVENTH